MIKSTLQSWVGAWKELKQWLLQKSEGIPEGAQEGAFWYDTLKDKPQWYDGTTVHDFGVSEHNALSAIDGGDPAIPYYGHNTQLMQNRQTNAGSASGYALLGSDGKLPSNQLPSYVDDVLEYTNKAAFPTTGESGKIYVDLTTNLTWRWSGSVYIEISPSLALGETSSTAYRGDRGKIAYDHSQLTASNPHGTTASQISSTATGDVSATNVQSAIAELASEKLSTTTAATTYAPINTTLADNAASSTLPTTTIGSLVSKIQQVRDYLKYLLDSINDCFRLEPVTVSATTDWDTVVLAGSYRIVCAVPFSATYNQPVGAFNYGQLRVFTGSNSQIVQEYIPNKVDGSISSAVYRRIKFQTGSNWTSWVRDIVSVDLDAKQSLDSTLTALAGLSSGIPLLTSDSAATSINRATLVESLRANSAISGGGTISVNSTFSVKWSSRFIIISNGKGSHFSTTGYFDIGMPSAGTVITGLGTSNKTVDANGILLGPWDALYYILPIGSTQATVANNFRLVNYSYTTEIPETWVLVALKNQDTEFVQFPNGVCLYAGESRTDHWQKQINSKQDALTIDETVIDGSTNPVTSNGVFDALLGKIDKIAIGGVWNYGGVNERRWRGIAAINSASQYNGGVLHVNVSSRFFQADIHLCFEGGASAITLSDFMVEWTGTHKPEFKVVSDGFMAYLYSKDPATWCQTSVMNMELGNGSNATVNYLNYNSATDPGTGTAPSYVQRSKLRFVDGLTDDAQSQITAAQNAADNAGTAATNAQTTADTKLARNGSQTMTGDLIFAGVSGTNKRYIQLGMGANDFARITAGATADNAGFLEIATADDGNEPIYVRQYSGIFGTIVRTATLLDGSGNTSFPGNVTIVAPAISDDSNKAVSSAWVKDVAAPISHTHGNITNAGAIGSTSGLPVVTSTNGVLTAAAWSTTNPTMDGTASVGSSTVPSRSDHRHPSDTSRLAIGSGLSSGANVVLRQYNSSNTYANNVIYLEY